MSAVPVQLGDVTIAPVVAADAGELLTLQRAAYTTEARLYRELDTAALFTGHLSEADLTMCARRGYREHRREQLRPGVVLVHLTEPLPAADEPAR